MKFGAYTLIKKIAEGGVADIYLAKTKSIFDCDKYLVCKCIRKNLTADEEFLASIINEAQCTTRLRHPNILSVFDLCREDDNAFLVMEYLDAQDFLKLIIGNNKRGETVPYTYAAYAIGQAALGLHAAHELTDGNGVPLELVHRDVSPENILFSSDGDIKIGDFGIAKTIQMPDITPPDVVKGKFNYMSPEQAWADKIDRRSDIFSLAAVLYEATTGRCFYPADSIDACIQCARMALYELPHNICPEYPPELEKILLKALDLDKKCRYATALEFKLALDHFIQSQNVIITKNDWVEYIKTRIQYPEMRLPRLKVEEFASDNSSLLAHDAPKATIANAFSTDSHVPQQCECGEIDECSSKSQQSFDSSAAQIAKRDLPPVADETATQPVVQPDFDALKGVAPLAARADEKTKISDRYAATLEAQATPKRSCEPSSKLKKTIQLVLLLAVIVAALIARSC